MEDEVGGPLISTNFSEISHHYVMSTFPNVFSEVSIKNENVMEADDLLRNGILIETSKGYGYDTSLLIFSYGNYLILIDFHYRLGGIHLT